MQNPSTAKPDFELLDNGDVVNNYKGTATVLANYEIREGHLEFASSYLDKKYRAQVVRAITENTEGHLNQNKIASYGIKGRPRDEVKPNLPPRPKMDKNMGDKTPAVVEWYFKYKPQEAYARYGVVLGEDGVPVRGDFRRVETSIEVKEATGQVGQYERVTEKKDAILAERATHMTFTARERVGAEGEAEEGDEQ